MRRMKKSFRERTSLSYCRGRRLDTTPAATVQHQRQGKIINSAKRYVLVAQKRKGGVASNKEYHLGFFNIWWRRMTREGVKEEKERVEKEVGLKNKERFKLLFKAKFKTNVDNPTLESEVDRKMVEDKIIGDEMMVEETSANQDPDDCGEFSVFDGIVVGGGVVRGDYGRLIYEQTQDF